MSSVEIETMRSVEDELWWYRALRANVLSFLGQEAPEFRLLDAGCGSGGMLARIHQQFPAASLTGLDFSARALELTQARRIGARLVRGSTDRLPFSDAEFDVALSLDVIIVRGVDERAAAGELHRVLRPGGRLIVNVPALNFLRGSHDIAVSIARRYDRPELRRLLEGAGFTIESLSYWNMGLMPVVAAVRWASRARTPRTDVRSDLAPMWTPLNKILAGIARFELAVSRQVALPFGTSLFSVARK